MTSLLGLTVRKALVVALVAATAIALAPPRAEAAPACAAPTGPAGPGGFYGSWSTAPPPAFPAGPAEIKTWSVSAIDPKVILAENGVSAVRSLDGGCTWNDVFTLPAVPSPSLPFSSVDSSIALVETSVAAPISYLAIEQLPEAGSKPHLLVSPDFGSTWRLARGLEDATGKPTAVATSAANPQIVYLLTDSSHVLGVLGLAANLATQIHRSTDGGASFDDLLPLQPNAPASGLVVDVFNPEEFWVYGPAGLWYGAAGEVGPVEGVQGPISYVDVAPAAVGVTRVLAFSAAAPVAFRSDDGGQTWTGFGLTEVAQSAASFSADVFAVAGARGVTLYVRGGSVDITPLGARSILDLHVVGISASTSTVIELVGRSVLGVEYWSLDISRPLTAAPGVDVDIPDLLGIDEDRSVLRPDGKRIVLSPRERKTIPYELALPKTPTPLDVYFLVDISGSMQGAINGVGSAMGEIVRRLQAARINVFFGVGQYRSFTNRPAYERVTDIAPPGPALETALESLRASGGGDETQLEALYQTATGEGHYGTGVLIQPGQQANFRPQALKVVLHATDEPISTGFPHRPYAEVIDALNVRGIEHVGLAIQDSPQEPRAPKPGMDQISAGTDSVAPRGGVDCDGDGDTDLEADDPLVCLINPSRAEEASAMAPAIVNLLKALEDRAAVGLEATTGAKVIEEIGPDPVVEGVNLKASNNLDFAVTYRCPPVEERRRFDVRLRAVARGVTQDAVDATVICLPPPPPAARPVLPILPFPPIIFPPPPAPPQPLSQPNPNPQPNPQSNPAAQGAFAAQEQEQPRLAYVQLPGPEAQAAAEESQTSAGDREYRMSRYRPASDDAAPPQALWLAGAIGMTFAYGCASLARARSQVQVAYARDRRRR